MSDKTEATKLMLKTFKEGLEAVKAIKETSGYVLVWPETLLCVKVTGPETSHATGVQWATVFRNGDRYPHVFNGMNEQAVLMQKGEVIRRSIKDYQKLIAEMEAILEREEA